MKIGIYNRYWHILGGGEKYIGAIAECLSRSGPVDLITHESFSKAQLEERLNLNLSRCRIVLLRDNSDHAAEECSSEYDLWINGTYQSSARSRARRSVLVVMFPFFGGKVLKVLWRAARVIPPAPIQAIFWQRHRFWQTYDAVVTLSSYAQSWIELWWGLKSYILPPPVDLIACPGPQEKRDSIISVGRFFAGGHNKKHAPMIEAFKQMYDAGICPSWQLHLCGGTHAQAIHQSYLKSVTEHAKGYPITIHTDVTRRELEALYCEASIYWHAAGYGEEEEKQPERFEHFGITTVEAMSAGCIPVVIAKAGQRETVSHDVSGYLWESIDELKRYTARLINDDATAERLRRGAIESSAAHSFDAFSKRLTDLLRQVL